MGVGVIAILLAFLALARALRNYSRLSSIPGPSFAGWSDLWRTYARNSPHYGRRLSGLHLEHGKAVRLGPNFVSVADPAVIYQLHQSEGAQYEGAIDVSAQGLVKAIRRYHTLDLTASLRIFATTFVSDFVLEGWLHKERINNQGTPNRYPSPSSMIEYLLLMSPARSLKRGRGGQLASCTRLPTGTSAAPRRNERILNVATPTQSPERIQNVAKGADCLVSTFVSAFYFLSKHPEVMSRLQDEIDTAFAVGSLSDLPLWREVNRLPYLNAILKESMRLSSAANFEEEILSPKGGATVAGTTICEGTVIGCSAHVLHFDGDVYGNDVHIFHPDRWLTPDAQRRRNMDRGLLVFNRGVRSFPDVQVAWHELKKVVVLLLMKFDVSFFS
ncbi:cytochrome P450 [Aspergillus heteromorphus CBS 117.55]|uniref:Cytochrome P450 n=1 Tax=Aspergillus heteromorphus CBS 117.55 TaxID=1448321 RepID=A0A317WR86_9EURO|nr:cytochrome P450 [Aspergillus heteromorphus CBS 117.55]PWY88221.1 cytochrome P450 [Aspergillus heteromorphus CBS 117.55]